MLSHLSEIYFHGIPGDESFLNTRLFVQLLSGVIGQNS